MDAGEPGKPLGEPCGEALGTSSGVSARVQLRSSLVNSLTWSLRGGSSPDLVRILQSVHDDVRRDAFAAALRHLDRAWRCCPGEALVVGPLYAFVLMLEGGDYTAALSVAESALAAAPDPDVAATQILALLQLNRYDEAVRHLEAALADYCVVPECALACAADEVVQHPAAVAPGWVGLGPSLDIVSRLATPDKVGVKVRVIDGQRLAQHRDVPLLGSGARTPADFRLDGRVLSKGRRLTTWARIGSLPGVAPRLRFSDRRRIVDVQPVGPPQPGWRWACTLNLDTARLRGDAIDVSAQLPDGSWCPLPDAPLLLQSPLPKQPRQRKFSGATSSKASVERRHIDVLIPVYGNRVEALACIESALLTTAGLARLVVIDDASTDELLISALDTLASDGRVTLLRNRKNLGFSGAVNRGLAFDTNRDAVLLNSDTLVFADWLMRLQAAAYSEPGIGTVTPLSNNGSIASYPRASDNPDVAPADAAALHSLAAAVNAGRRIEIPVGVGFCLYLKRDCLNAVGNLDAAVFGKGYGEETDFCMRARAHGWTHRLAADVYVSHAGGSSFGTRRTALLDRSQRLLNLRHPGYDRSILRFQADDPTHIVRRRLDEHRLRAHTGRHVLIATLALSGGVDRFVKERCQQLRALGVTPILLRPTIPKNRRRCELQVDGLDVPNLKYDIPSELPALQELLRAISFESIELQHFLDLDARVIETVRALPTAYDVFVHDYAWMCPRITLIDGSGQYCGEPAVSVCETCVKRNGSSLREGGSVKALRARSSTWLREARRVIAPSGDTAARFKKHFPGLDVDVRPHSAPPLPATAELEQPRAARKTVRIALIGAIGGHKGYDVLLACARDARARQLPIEFVVIGYTENDAPLLATKKVFVTGPYIDGEAPHLIAREQPDAIWLPSVWPETWCYTLDYALSSHLPVIAFDLGAIAERLRTVKPKLLLPLTTKSQRTNDALLDFINGAALAAPATPNSVKSLRTRARRMASIEDIKSLGTRMVKSVNDKAPPPTPEAGLSASVQVLPLASGLYLFSVKAAQPQASVTSGQLSLPAMHVGLGPGVRSEQVEFLSSPSTHGGWLFAAADQLVTRVNGTGATLVLTSVRAPNGNTLSIKVERLEARVDATEAAATAATAPLKLVANAKAANAPLSIRIAAHIRARGDTQFLDAPWAGRVGAGLWIESFAVQPMESLSAHDIEYKGLTGSGFETPWLSDNAACGTKGMSVPLVGFAVRLRPSAHTAGYDCECSGYFQSGLTVGPLRNGAPCRSSVANDPLEGIQVRLVKRASNAAGPAAAAAKSKNGTAKSGKRVALAR